MRKKAATVVLVFFLLAITACSDKQTSDPQSTADETEDTSSEAASSVRKEMALDFSFGTRTGIYEGDINKDGLPDGYGTFTSESSDGTGWTYTGDWVAGHWEGTGTSTWSDGQVYTGGYSGDESSGSGTFTFSNGICFKGEFVDSSNGKGYAINTDGSTYYADIVDGNLCLYGVYRKGGFNDDLDEFQGEWKEVGSQYRRLIISGESINFVSETEIGSKSYRHVYVFYFSYDQKDDLIVVNENDQPRYDIQLRDDGFLYITSDDDESCYEKISDSIEVPKEKVEPAIGMTKDEVTASTWGNPSDINKTTTAAGEHEQWVYDDGYIYFDDGIVTAIQEK